MKSKMPERSHQQLLPLTELTAVSPLDGRYRERIAALSPYFSEYGLIRTRFEVEAKFLVAISQAGVIRTLTPDERKKLNSFGQNTTPEEAQKVKEIENETRHDVKAMERVFRGSVSGTSLEDLTESIHFGLTSEDINNISYRLMLQRATREVVLPVLNNLIDQITLSADKNKSLPMLARTHGQPAVPTTLGKELVVFADRLNSQSTALQRQKLKGKLNGAVGNLNALAYAAPNFDWIKISQKLVQSLGLEPNIVTTQINPYDDIVEYLQNYHRINSVILDFDQDMWRYISDDWFVQEVRSGEVGSSTMPQKVNPIDFENSEGNIAIANGLIEALARKLPVSRLQRDLSDSTTVRNVGVAVAHSFLAYQSAMQGLSRVSPNELQINEALLSNWTVLGEPVQTLLRREGVDDPYSLVSSLTKGHKIDAAAWDKWVDSLSVNREVKSRLKKLTPQTYIGEAVSITQQTVNKIRKSRKK